jgi:predicted alpha/beta superfamily hydrolase
MYSIKCVLFISKLLDYETSTERYPVLFLLDGGGHFHHTTATTRFLASNQFAPEMLVVGIGNTDRTRDVTHGGAPGFQTFIPDELVPWLESEWGVSENNRRARFYKRTPRGRKRTSVEFSNRSRLVGAVNQVVDPLVP